MELHLKINGATLAYWGLSFVLVCVLASQGFHPLTWQFWAFEFMLMAAFIIGVIAESGKH